jgi:hypothetical protein
VLIQTYFPNRTSPRSFTAAATTFKMVASDGTLHDTYVALLAAGKVAWPGTPDDFPMGVPVVNIRTTNAAGTGDGSSVAIKTNTTMTPASIHDADTLVSGSGQQLSMPGGVKNIWIAQTVGSDYVMLLGAY